MPTPGWEIRGYLQIEDWEGRVWRDWSPPFKASIFSSRTTLCTLEINCYSGRFPGRVLFVCLKKDNSSELMKLAMVHTLMGECQKESGCYVEESSGKPLLIPLF